MLHRTSDGIADNIYLNLSINNTSDQTTSPATFDATYDQPILDKPSDYYATVVKFEVPLQTLPLLVFPLEDEQTELENNSVGTVSQVGTAVTGVRTRFNQLMIGASITHSGGTATIVSVQNPTMMVVSAPLVAAGSTYAIGVAGVGTVSQSKSLVTGVGTAFSIADVGRTITLGGISQNITSFTNATLIQVSGEYTIAPGSTYVLSDYTAPNQANRFNLSSAIVGVCENNQPGSIANIPPVLPPYDYTPIPAFTENLVYVPASQVVNRHDLRYPYVYSYALLIQMINSSLLNAWVAAGSPGGAGASPYFSYSPTEAFILLVLPPAFVENGANGWTVCFNNAIQSIFPSFQIFLSNDPAFPNGRYEINTNQFAGIVSTTGPGYDQFYLNDANFPTPTYVVTQDYQTVDYLNSVRKIVLLTNSIPVRKEFFPPANTSNSGAANTVPIMSDFQIDLNATAGAQRSVAIYEAQIYRLIDLISDSPMKKINISLFWADQNNNLYPIYLNKNDSATIKLGFFSKALYENSEMKM